MSSPAGKLHSVQKTSFWKWIHPAGRLHREKQTDSGQLVFLAGDDAAKTTNRFLEMALEGRLHSEKVGL